MTDLGDAVLASLDAWHLSEADRRLVVSVLIAAFDYADADADHAQARFHAAVGHASRELMARGWCRHVAECLADAGVTVAEWHADNEHAAREAATIDAEWEAANAGV